MDFNDTIRKAFEELNQKLREENLSLTVICAGGFVLSYLGVRATKDVDGFFQSTSIIEEKIKEVGDKLDLNTNDELWLNNSIQNLNPYPDESICDTIYDFSNLKILIPPLIYVAGMKLKSGRAQDIHDVANIVTLIKSYDPIDFHGQIKKFGFGGIDFSLILEAFGYSYGMDWLEEYFKENESLLVSLVY